MKISIAQMKPVKGDVSSNIDKHKNLINLAISLKADAIFFPELSITGYEPTLSKALATNINDQRFDDFQQISDKNSITIGIGMPIKSKLGVLIGMIIFQPYKSRQVYSKQKLHVDELPYFTCGNQQLILTIKNTKVVPAICYESLLPEHAENAHKMGGEVYLASVSKSQNGVDKAIKHFPDIACKYAMAVLMSNCVGYCDNFESVGNTSIWNDEGSLIAQLNAVDEGIIIYDTDTKDIVQEYYQSKACGIYNPVEE